MKYEYARNYVFAFKKIEKKIGKWSIVFKND